MANLIVRQGRTPSPMQWDPFQLAREMLGWDPFRDLERRGWAKPAQYAPDFNIREREDAYVIEADLPGVKEDDVNVSLTGNQLTVSGSRHEEERKEGENYYLYERTYGDFSRTFTLPAECDAEGVEARLADGVLTVVAPKRPEAKPRRIPLKTRIKDRLSR